MRVRLAILLPLLTIVLMYPTLASPFPADKYYPPNENAFFKLKFIDTTAGDWRLETLPMTTWEGRPAHHFRATVRTVGLIGLIYPYVETVDLYYDREKQLPLFVDINIHDRKKVQHTQIKLDSVTKRGEEIEDSTEPDEPKHHRVKSWFITPGAQSLFSILHYLRTNDLKPGSEISFPVSHDERNVVFAAKVTGPEKIQIAGSEKDAIVLHISPSFTKNYYPNVEEVAQLWFSNDAQKTLLRFELKHRLGKVFGVLQQPAAE